MEEIGATILSEGWGKVAIKIGGVVFTLPASVSSF